MTIHHDKMAYGNLASMKEELSEEKLLKMLEKLNGEEEKKEEAPKKEAHQTEENKNA